MAAWGGGEWASLQVDVNESSGWARNADNPKQLEEQRVRKRHGRAGKLIRGLAAIATGGMLLQTAGCATTFAPLALSLLENIILSQLIGAVNGF